MLKKEELMALEADKDSKSHLISSLHEERRELKSRIAIFSKPLRLRIKEIEQEILELVKQPNNAPASIYRYEKQFRLEFVRKCPIMSSALRYIDCQNKLASSTGFVYFLARDEHDARQIVEIRKLRKIARD